MIGGGGGGCGADGGGGGGAGGIRTNISGIIPAPYTNGAMGLPASTYNITVGRGGARTGALPASGGYDVGKDGESSGFNSLVAGGGGRVLDLVVLVTKFQHHSRMEAVLPITVQVAAAVPTAAVAVLVVPVLVTVVMVLEHLLHLLGLVAAAVALDHLPLV